MMERRAFLSASLSAAGAATVGFGADPHPLLPGPLPEQDLPPSLAALAPMTGDEPAAITDEERWARIAKAQGLMGQAGLDAVVMTGGTAMRYFADVQWGLSERTFALVLPREGEPAWVCPAFERERAAEGIRFGGDIRTWEENENPYALIAAIAADRGMRTGRIGLEETVRYHVVQGLAGVAPALEITSADPVTIPCRAVKSPAEIALQKYANQVTIVAYEAAWNAIEEGMSQSEFSRLLSTAFSRLGYSGGAMVLFGPNSAYPHGTSREEVIREGTTILFDGGTRVGGYPSDITRSGVWGQPSVEQRRVWTLVKDAQTAALEAALPGALTGDVDRAAREVIDRGGYGPGYRYFTHRLGHGIGMDGHEWYYLVEGSDTILEPGMTFSNEPGIYKYSEFGIRLEDIMVITEEGAELYTPQAATPACPFTRDRAAATPACPFT